jgi:RNA 3'-terminal phosphate cyclase (ATP)
MGEAGGQVLRTSLALSVCLAKPFRIVNIRSGRKTPGLLHQHRTAVTAAAQVGEAEVRGNALGSPELEFIPQSILPSEYEFDIGSAGSTILVLQTVLPALLTAGAPSRIILEGGTHNPSAPSFEFLKLAFLPLINQMGPRVSARLLRPGFYPAGGGRIEVTVQPAEKLRALVLDKRGSIQKIWAEAMVSKLPEHIGRRELAVVARELNLKPEQLHLRHISSARGPGNVVYVAVRAQRVTEVFVGVGKKGLRAETVAQRLVSRVREYLPSDAAVAKRLADQLLLPLAMAGGGRFTTLEPTLHTRTALTVIQAFIERSLSCRKLSESSWEIGWDQGGEVRS